MAYTAIVLSIGACERLRQRAAELELLPAGWVARLHHVTLGMGAKTGHALGAVRELTVTHFGTLSGRATAFRVAGADDAANKVPHVTIAHSPDAKPVESNAIVEWVAIEPFTISGIVKVCS